MKVLFCTNVFEKVSNGPAKFANLLIRDSSETDEIRILTEDCRENSDKVYKVPIKIPSLLQPLSQFIRMVQYHRKAMEIRKTFPFDVLVYNNAIVAFASMLWFRPTFGMINDYTNATCRESMHGFRGESGLKRRVFFYIEKWFCSWSSQAVITNSAFLSGILAKSYGVPKGKFRILHKGIETSLLQQNRKDLQRQKNPDSLLFIKTNYKLAGLEILARALNQFQRPVSLSIAGPEPAFHQEILSLFTNKNISVHLLGNQSQEEVFALMRSHEVFCLPAFKEAFGVSILEALACGCRVVASNTGGIPEALGTGNWGSLCKAGDEVSLRHCLEEVLAEKKTDMDLSGLQEHLEKYSEKEVRTYFIQILKGAC